MDVPPFEKYMNCFQLGTIINRAALNIHSHTDFYVIFLGKYAGVQPTGTYREHAFNFVRSRRAVSGVAGPHSVPGSEV